jgi:hypothetical protein
MLGKAVTHTNVSCDGFILQRMSVRDDSEISQLGASLYGSLKLGPTPLIETFDVLTD